MNKIEIQTPQNVTIDIKLASAQLRAVAFLIDQIFLILILVIAFVIATLFDTPEHEKWFIVFLAIIFSLYFFYSLILEVVLNGKTLGKIMVGLRVRKTNGSPPEIIDFLTRWVFRIPDIAASAGLLAFFLVGSSKRNQRLGDILANTIVVYESSRQASGLSEILQLKEQEGVTIAHPEVAQLSEESILTIKELVIRKKEYNEKVYDELIQHAIVQVEEVLSISAPKNSKEDFLKKIVREYVIVTR